MQSRTASSDYRREADLPPSRPATAAKKRSALQIPKVRRGDELPQPGSTGRIQFDEIQLVVVLRDRPRVVQREVEQDLEDGLVRAAVPNDENRPGGMLLANRLNRRPDPIAERDPRLAAVECVFRIPSAPLELGTGIRRVAQRAFEFSESAFGSVLLLAPAFR